MRLKIGVIGPSESGKSTLTNLLGSDEGTSGSDGTKLPYRPTHSVRIIEFTATGIELKKYSSDVDVQLWEVGGHPKLKPIWPGVQAGLDGVIFVYDTGSEVHLREVSALHMNFVTHSSLAGSPGQVFLVGNIFRGGRSLNQKVIGVSNRVRQITVNLIEDDPGKLREEFRGFLATVSEAVADKDKGSYAE